MAERNTSGIVSIVVVVLIIVTLGVLSFLKRRECQRVAEQVKVVEEEVKRMRKQVEEKKQLKRKIREAMKAVAELTKILPNRAEIEEANFLKLLYSFQERSKVKLVALSPLQKIGGRGTAQKGYRQHKYDIKLSGTYTQFVKFLHLLETHKRYFKVDSFNLKASTYKKLKPNESPELSISMRVTTYTYE